MSSWRLPFDNTYARLPEQFYQRIFPTPVQNPRLLIWNEPLAEELGLDSSLVSKKSLAEVFSGSEILAGSEPLAQAYAGHQYAHFVPQLGDGRAHLLGELCAARGRVDLQLKGSGPTRFSRRGDGRAALGPMLREFIIGEALHALGIPGSRILAVVSTGEQVQREQLLPGAVAARVASSHIRVGTFEYFAFRGDQVALKQLADYTLERHYPSLKHSAHRYVDLFCEIQKRQAQLIAQWLSVGFVHGVMNTDNMFVSGESLDFGPCAFLDHYDPHAVWSSIDHHGRYAYGRQPHIAHWNLAVLGQALKPLFSEDPTEAERLGKEALDVFPFEFQKSYQSLMLRKIGFPGFEVEHWGLVEEFLAILSKSSLDFTNSFAALESWASGDALEEPSEGEGSSEFCRNESLRDWVLRWRAAWKRKQSADSTLACLRAQNPKVIARNHLVEKALSQANSCGDIQPTLELVRVLRSPFELATNDALYRRSPAPSERVTATFCGT